MSGFKDFVLRGNVVELAVAVVIATAFGKVVEAMVKIIMQIVGKIGGSPDFSAWEPAGLSIGNFLTVLISFLILAAVVYFFVVKPYAAAKARFFPDEPETETVDPNTELLKEIRDSLRARPNL
ncbi:large conductance mechanosensitive channel protein MscL [Knoellia flava TL1]|uniref:Large-conductance mechanosensitive channel n=2 Tax=Knoellia flava TaxID=913969 RepID=A0A8H9FV13_9MICO|nr:large conductance mechanosensitive channel protein MscL [Knoellia flava]KGN30045.1 large conductance mechanosensitive channel protein MscL [Knoellia flava TL1]MDT0213197.1 large conductance mechanosensitive channel protein MscL [Rothia sp. ARF10]GGB82015.1 large-conductance mechanosensitive channel [Knoellia flava]